MSPKKNIQLCIVKFDFIVTVIRTSFNSNKRIKSRDYVIFAWGLVPKYLLHKFGLNVAIAFSVLLKDQNNILLTNI